MDAPQPKVVEPDKLITQKQIELYPISIHKSESSGKHKNKALHIIPLKKYLFHKYPINIMLHQNKFHPFTNIILERKNCRSGTSWQTMWPKSTPHYIPLELAYIG